MNFMVPRRSGLLAFSVAVALALGTAHATEQAPNAAAPSTAAPSTAATSAAAVAGDAAPNGVDMPVRKLPHGKLDAIDLYPPKARRLNLSGRTLLEFHIGPDGRATAFQVIQTDAAPLLQSAASSSCSI
jgi:outer membrane biosynthesis protein TonB